MSALTLGSTTIPVRPNGAERVWEDLTSLERSHAGYLRSAITATRGRARVWRVSTPPMEPEEADALEAVLEPLGRLEANGYVVDDVATDVHVRNIERGYEREGNFCYFSFELHEAFALAASVSTLDHTVGGDPVAESPVGG
jgi:hypothetical protein